MIMNYQIKIPDYNGGFVYKSYESYHVVTRDEDGYLQDIQPVNLLKKGLATDKGEIVSFDNDTVELLKDGEVQKADRYLFNSYLIKKAIDTDVSKGLYKSVEFEKKHPRDKEGKFTFKSGEELKAEFEDFCKNIVGKYEPPKAVAHLIYPIRIRKGDFRKFYKFDMPLGRNEFAVEAEKGNIDFSTLKYKDIVRPEAIKYIKELITNPDEIRKFEPKKHTTMSGDYIFTIKRDNQFVHLILSKADVIETGGTFGINFVEKNGGKIIYTKEKGLIKSTLQTFPQFANSPAGEHGQLKLHNNIDNVKYLNISDVITEENNLITKAFGNIIKFNFGKNNNPGSTPKQQAGAERPGHKYITRKPNPNPKDPSDKWIYIYQLPSGKMVGKNSKNEEVKLDEGGNVPEKDFEAGEKITYQNRNAVIEERSANVLGIRFEDGSTEAIDLREYKQNLADQKNYRINSTANINGKDYKIKHIDADRTYAFLKADDGETKLINFERPIERGHKAEGKAQSVEGKTTNYNYREQPEYKAFADISNKKGFGRKDDLTYVKFVDQESEKYKLERQYDPENKEVKVFVDGIEDYKIEFEGIDYKVVDMNENSFLLQDKKGDLFQLSNKDYKDYQNELSGKTVIEKTGDSTGGMLVKNEKKVFNFKPTYTPEQEERFQGRRYKFTRFKSGGGPIQSLLEKQQIEQENQVKQQRIKEILSSQEYLSSKEIIQNRGFEVQQNPFTAHKKIKFNGLDYELSSRFDSDNNVWVNEVSKGAYKELKLGDNKYKISDISRDNVYYYDENGEERYKSIDELKKENGRSIFEPTKQSKGLISTKIFNKQLIIDSNTKVPYWTEIIEAEDLIPSHFYKNGEFVFNDKYSIKEAQNRVYDDKAIAITEAIKNNPDFDQLDDIHTSISGAPIVDMDYEAYGGNNRSMGIISHYEAGGTKYKNKLMEHAEELGYNTDEIGQMKQPVLVRRTNVTKEQAKVLGGRTNQSLAKTQDNREIGKAKVMQIKAKPEVQNKIFDAFRSVKNHNIDSFAKYIDVIGGDIFDVLRENKIIGDNEIGQFQTTSGKLNKEAIQSIAHQLVFGDSDEYFRYIPDDIDKGLSMSLGNLMALQGNQSVQEPLNNAIMVIGRYNQMDSNGKAVFKDKYGDVYSFIENHQDMFLGSVQKDSRIMAMVELLTEKNPKEIKDKFTEYRYSMEDSMFNTGLSPEDAFKKYFPATRVKKSLLSKAVDTIKNALLPSKKNPAVRRWQSQMDVNKYAQYKHNGQVYGNGEDYYNSHLLPVEKTALEIAKNEDVNLDEVRTVALLHDVVEDTSTTREEIEKIFGKKIADCVDALSKKGDVSPEEYYHNISSLKIARIVKAADRINNLNNLNDLKDEEKKEKLTKKYTDSYQYFEKYGIYPELIKEQLDKISI